MKEIIIATHNQGKLKEFKVLLEPLGYKVLSLEDFDVPEIDEPYSTFEENAKHKAEFLSNKLNKMVLADDSGLCVDTLGGRPGVFSARWVREGASKEENINHLWSELKSVGAKKNPAHYNTTIALAIPNHNSIIFSATWNGEIIFEERGRFGFSYDSVFYIAELGKTAAELTTEEKNKYSQRTRAIQQVIDYLKK